MTMPPVRNSRRPATAALLLLCAASAYQISSAASEVAPGTVATAARRVLPDGYTATMPITTGGSADVELLSALRAQAGAAGADSEAADGAAHASAAGDDETVHRPSRRSMLHTSNPPAYVAGTTYHVKATGKCVLFPPGMPQFCSAMLSGGEQVPRAAAIKQVPSDAGHCGPLVQPARRLPRAPTPWLVGMTPCVQGRCPALASRDCHQHTCSYVWLRPRRSRADVVRAAHVIDTSDVLPFRTNGTTAGLYGLSLGNANAGSNWLAFMARMGINYGRLFVNTNTDLRASLGSNFGELKRPAGRPADTLARIL